MTEDEKYDRWERFAKIVYERSLRESRESRNQTAKWKTYFAADREHEAAKLTAAENPTDSDTSETLRRAAESLNQAREELRLSIGNR